MAEYKVLPGPLTGCESPKHAVCISAKQVYDSCRDKDCYEKVSVYLTGSGQDVINHTPMGKFGSANDMCGAIRWLIDDRSAGFVTGITVPVDGGFLTLSGV